MLPKRLGIYGYFCLITGMVYVGQGKNIWKRARDHEKGLARGTHHCTYLQNAWNKYGSENFEWRVIELCSCEEELTEREQHWINHYNGTVGIYNISLIRCVSAFPLNACHKHTVNLRLSRASAKRHSRAGLMMNSVPTLRLR